MSEMGMTVEYTKEKMASESFLNIRHRKLMTFPNKRGCETLE